MPVPVHQKSAVTTKSHGYRHSQHSLLKVKRWYRCKLTNHPWVFIDPTSSPPNPQGWKFITQRDCYLTTLLQFKSLEVNAKAKLLPSEGEQTRLVWGILRCLELYSCFLQPLLLNCCLNLSISPIYHKVFKLRVLTH